MNDPLLKRLHFWWVMNDRDSVLFIFHYDNIIMGAAASQITSLTIVYSAVYADQSKHQSSASLAFVWGIHRGPVNSPHIWPVTRKMFPFDDVIMDNDLSIVSPSYHISSPSCSILNARCHREVISNRNERIHIEKMSWKFRDMELTVMEFFPAGSWHLL